VYIPDVNSKGVVGGFLKDAANPPLYESSQNSGGLKKHDRQVTDAAAHQQKKRRIAPPL